MHHENVRISIGLLNFQRLRKKKSSTPFINHTLDAAFRVSVRVFGYNRSIIYAFPARKLKTRRPGLPSRLVCPSPSPPENNLILIVDTKFCRINSIDHPAEPDIDPSLFRPVLSLPFTSCTLNYSHLHLLFKPPIAMFGGFPSTRHGASSGCGRRNSLQIWRLPANILNKQSRTADEGWSSSLRGWEWNTNFTRS